jgi:outer membrane protein assembly factor BamB
VVLRQVTLRINDECHNGSDIKARWWPQLVLASLLGPTVLILSEPHSVKTTLPMSFSLLPTTLSLLLTATCCLAENWPQWRGPRYDGVSRESGLPTEWSDTQNLLWKAPLPGVGSATPAVWGDRIFLTSEGDNDLVLLCLGTDGKEQWRHKLGEGVSRGREQENNGASSSPCTDGKLVVALVGSGDFVTLDLSGKEVWRFDAQERYGRFRYDFGMHTTPVLHDGRLYLQLIHPRLQVVVALDAANGKELWQVNRPSDGRGECLSSYATPCLWERGGDACLITHGNDYAVAHSLVDGKEVWRLGDLNPKDRYDASLRFIASPVAVADLIVIPTAKNGAVVGVSPDARGVLSAGGKGEAWRVARGTPDVPSPVVFEGRVFLCRETGVLTCLDAKTGKQFFSERFYLRTYRASPVIADGKLILTAKDGTFTVVKPGEALEILAKNKLSDQFAASPAISNGRLYLRGFANL